MMDRFFPKGIDHRHVWFNESIVEPKQRVCDPEALFSFLCGKGIRYRSYQLQILQAGQVRRETFAVKAAQARNLGGAFITSADSAEDLLICGGIPELLQQHIWSFPDQTAVRGKEQGSGCFLYGGVFQKENDILCHTACHGINFHCIIQGWEQGKHLLKSKRTDFHDLIKAAIERCFKAPDLCFHKRKV